MNCEYCATRAPNTFWSRYSDASSLMKRLSWVPRPKGLESSSGSSYTAKLPSAALSHTCCLGSELDLLTT